ncbi:hypothetical protein [Helicobacter typhlonius]|uniref:hypothetical protein n=1 Tax=Helicobacter typhlonius TaxID=76936 RepID=UPI002FE1D84D
MEEDSQSKLKYFPVMMFAITMGFGGLTIDYKRQWRFWRFHLFYIKFSLWLSPLWRV